MNFSQQIICDLSSIVKLGSILTVVDRSTKAARCVPATMKINAPQLARVFFDNVFRFYGMPRVIISDKDRRFRSSFWQALMQYLGTQLRMSTAFHPQTDGQAERYNRTVQEMLRSYIDFERRQDWDLLLTPLEFAYNRAVQSSTGLSPFMMMYVQQPNVPRSMLAPAAKNTSC